MGKCFSNYSNEVHFNKEQIMEFVHLEHPLQTYVAETLGVEKYKSVPNLPGPYMLGMDRASVYFNEGDGKYGKGYGIASLQISHDDPWFWSHFPADPVMPGSHGVDAIMQLAGLWAGCTAVITGRPRALEGRFTYNGQVLPNSKVIYYRIDVKRFLKKKKVVFFDGTLSVDDPDNFIYSLENGKLAFFSHEDLSINPKSDYFYNPNWELVKSNVIQWIENMEQFYARWRKA